jgi:hypothetical protein
VRFLLVEPLLKRGEAQIADAQVLCGRFDKSNRQAGTLAGAVTSVIVWALSTHGTHIPGGIGAAITTLLTFAVA